MSDDALIELGEHIKSARPDCVLSYDLAFGELTVNVALASVKTFVEYLRTDKTCRFTST